MSTAQGFYEVYKALPKKTQKEVKHLIEREETVEVSVSAIEKGLNEVKSSNKSGKKLQTLSDFLHESNR